jgi:hypothetical protein
LTALTLALAVAGCGRQRAGDSTPQRSRNMMTIVEIQEGASAGIANAYDLIMRYHPEWMRSSRSTTTAGEGLTATVWLDQTRIGGLGSLRSMLLGSITQIRYLTPTEARGELGFDNEGGAIVVSTR